MTTANKRLNIIIGVLMTGVPSLLTIGLLLNEYQRPTPAFAVHNAWLWFALLALIPLGFAVVLIGLRRGLGCGYFIWSQLVLCMLVSSIYIGWHRRELDYVKMGPDPDALYQGPPQATFFGFMFPVLIWLIVGFLPLAIRQIKRRRDAHKNTA